MSKLTPIERWADDAGKSPRWAREKCATGEILAIKIGGSYFITDELVAAMSARATPASAAEALEVDGWDQITRTA